jgi:AsmA protein
MRFVMKRALLIAAGVVGLVVVMVLGLWLFFDANRFRPTLEDKLSTALGRKVTVGNVRLALLSGGMSVDDLAIADDPAFSAQPFVTAKGVTVGVDLMPLILSRSLRVESFRLEQPRVVLLRAASGSWNFSRLGASSASAARPAVRRADRQAQWASSSRRLPSPAVKSSSPPRGPSARSGSMTK